MQTAQSLSQLQPSYIREILAAATSPDVISLAGGLPAESCFPMDLMSASLSALSDQPQLFQYGATRGYAPLVEYVETNLSVDKQHHAVVCNGSQQALDLVARAFLDPGDNIVMEAPGYLGAIQVFSLRGACMLPVNQQSDGPDLDQLEHLLKSRSVRFFYAVPDFHNPTGVAWSLEKRCAVAQLCTQWGVVLIEDAPYRDIRFAGTASPMVSSFCQQNAIVLRSFSKSICPGMRLGIATASADFIDPMILVKQAADLHTSVPLQSVLLDTLNHPQLITHRKKTCIEYGERYLALRNALKPLLDQGAEFDSVEGGMFIWLKLPDGDAMALANRAIENKLAVVPGNVFYTDGNPDGCFLRLNFTHTPPVLFTEAVARLQKSIE